MPRKHPSVLTKTGWAVLWGIILGTLATMMLWTGCDGPTAQPLPSTVTPAPKPVVTDPADLPEGAIRYRKVLIRAWQEYFALAEPASIGFGQVTQESRWKPSAVSPVGARGLGQFMPATADWIHEMLPPDLRIECGNSKGCPEDPKWALNALAKFDYLLFREQAAFSPAEDHWAATLAAYNGGSGNLRKEKNLCREVQSGGRIRCDETKWYGNVEMTCIRTPANCRENRDYPVLIMRKWRPMFVAWLGE